MRGSFWDDAAAAAFAFWSRLDDGAFLAVSGGVAAVAVILLLFAVVRS